MGLIIPNSFASKTSAQLSDLDQNFTYLKTELDPYIDNILVGESGQVTIDGGVIADITGNVLGNVTGNVTGDVTGNVSGNAGTVTNGVYTTGDQTIGGNKTFSNTIVGNINGNSATVTNGVYTTNFSGTNQSLTSNGYQRLPGGLIMQWGTSSNIAQDSSGNVSFPTAFSNACFNIVITPIGALQTTSGGIDTVDAITTSGFTIRHGADSTRAFYWQAIGY